MALGDLDLRQRHVGVPGFGDRRKLARGGGGRRWNDDAVEAGRAKELASAQAGIAFHVLAAVNAVELESRLEEGEANGPGEPPWFAAGEFRLGRDALPYLKCDP